MALFTVAPITHICCECNQPEARSKMLDLDTPEGLKYICKPCNKKLTYQSLKIKKDRFSDFGKMLKGEADRRSQKSFDRGCKSFDESKHN